MIASLMLAAAVASAPAEPWITRHRPARGLWELGTFAGAFIVAKPHDFYDPALSYRRLRRAGPDVGLRAAYYPLALLGIEGEFASIWTAAKYGGEPAFLYGLRLHAVLQLPMFRVTPFVLGGYGLGGVRSARDALGNDLDPLGHYGVGVKFFATPWIALRVEGRHLIGAAARQRRVIANHGEVLLGISVTLGRGKLRAPTPAVSAPVDGDGDGVVDAHDRCPAVAGGGSDGCPIADGDGDGVADRHDDCPQQPGGDVHGCPLPVAAPEPMAEAATDDAGDTHRRAKLPP